MRNQIFVSIFTCLRLFSLVEGFFPRQSTFYDYDDTEAGLRILNGQDAKVRDLSFVVAVEVADGLCTGSIISNSWVITAGHCIVGLPCRGRRVRPAAWTLMDFVEATYCVVHPQYTGGDGSTSNIDLGLIQVKPEFQNDGKTSIVALLKFGSPIAPGTPATITGYGQTEHGLYTARLKQATVYVEEWNVCNMVFKAKMCHGDPRCRFPDLRTNIFCLRGAGPRPPGTCYGDSGGPVIVNGYLAGIAQFILAADDGECETGPPSYFTRVDTHLPWIHRYTPTI